MSHEVSRPLLLALDQVPALIAVLRGPDLVYEFVNAAYAASVPVAAPIGKPFGSSTHDRSQEIRAVMERVYRTGEPASFYESQVMDGEGELRFYDIRFVAMRDDSGAIDGVMIHAVDVTELVRERNRSARTAEQLRRLADADLLGIGYFAKGRDLVDANDELLRILGYDREDLRAGRVEWARLTPPEHAESTARALRELAERGAYSPFEKEYFRKDGTRISVLVGGAALDEGRTAGAAFVLDLTPLKEAEQRNAELQAKLLQVQKLESLGVLAGGIAHDFNNLLTVILGNVSTAAMAVPKGHVALDSLQEATLAISRAADLTRQLLAYAGKGRFRIEAVDLSAQVRGVSALLRASVPKSVALSLDLAADLPGVEADAAQLQQLLMNLVINGAEAITSSSGAVVVTTRAEQLEPERARPIDPVLAPGPYVVLEVKDTGRGMDEATKRRIFDPFFTTKLTGRGLGLASVLGIIRSHRAGIEVESSPGEGATFRVWFPSMNGPAASRQERQRAALVGRGLVLVVDDDDNVRRTAGRLIEMLGFEVAEASGGKHAVELFSARPADFTAVILDLTMPGMSGEQTARALRAIRGDVPIVVTSGYDETDAGGWTGADGITTFLAKPFTVDDLTHRLREVLPKAT